MRFRDYGNEKEKWITFVESDFYPDYLETAREKYFKIFEQFHILLRRAKDSDGLLRLIMNEPAPLRVQLLRVFRKYVSPDTSVEMLKIKARTEKIINEFGSKFRSIDEVRKRFNPKDDSLVAILREYEDRGQKGYELSSGFFEWFRNKFGGHGFTIEGPERAGKDIYLNEVLEDYPNPRPADFLVRYKTIPVVVGFIRYDSDRGGAQEDDRTSGYRGVVAEMLEYSERKKPNLKVIFVNEGPGLILGSMWDDYADLEDTDENKVMVVTLKMLDSRLTSEWMLL